MGGVCELQQQIINNMHAALHPTQSDSQTLQLKLDPAAAEKPPQYKNMHQTCFVPVPAAEETKLRLGHQKSNQTN